MFKETNNNNNNNNSNNNTDANTTNSTYPIPPLPSSSLYLYTSQDLPLFQILLEYSKTLSYSAFKLHLYYIVKLLQSKKPINFLDIQDFCKEVNMGNGEDFSCFKGITRYRYISKWYKLGL